MLLDHQNDIKQVTGELESQIGIFKDKNLELENYINKLVLEKEENEEKIKRLLLFEKEIKEKNLLIGKLKHEGKNLYIYIFSYFYSGNFK